LHIKETRPLVDAAVDRDYAWKYYQIGRAEYIPFQQKLAQEQEMYFVPSFMEGKKRSTAVVLLAVPDDD